MEQRIMAFKINGTENDLSVFWGEKITVEWEIEKEDDTADQAENGAEIAVLYPRNWSIRQRKGSMEIAVYEDTEFILRAKNPKNGFSEQRIIRARIKEGKAEAEITVMLKGAQNSIEPYAQLDISYKNASYGYINRGGGRIDGGSALLYPDTGRKIYRFLIPYLDLGTVSCYSQEFELWMEQQ